ncbi:MAG: hypothetical protein RLZ45_1335, partial [Verrucomicrobiota bacterium]
SVMELVAVIERDKGGDCGCLGSGVNHPTHHLFKPTHPTHLMNAEHTPP